MTRENLSSYLKRQAVVCRDHCEIDKELYEKFGVKRGLRDKEGVGVLAGLTNISNIQSSKIVDGKKFRVRDSFSIGVIIYMIW